MGQILQFNEITDYVTAMNLDVVHRHPDFLVYDYNTHHPETCPILHSFRQNYFEVTLEISGGCNTVVDQFELPPAENRLTLISPHRLQTLQEYQPTDDKSHKGYGMFFKPDFINTDPFNARFMNDYPFFSHLNAPFIPLEEQETGVYEDIILRILDEHESGGTNSREIIRNYLNIFFLKANENYRDTDEKPSPKSSRDREIFEEFSALVQRHFLEWRSVRTYAGKLHITPKHLSKTVKKVSGESALSLIHQAQINHAKALLRQTPKTVSEIAYDLNFENPEYFSVFFKRVSGESPSQYRVS